MVPVWSRTAIALISALALSAGVAAGQDRSAPVTAAQKTPCVKHTAYTRVTKARCLKAWRAQVRRDRMVWPPLPVTTRDLRVRGVPIARFVRLARCEAGIGSEYGGARWTTPDGWVYQGGLGMWHPDRTAGHPYGRNAGALPWQAQMLIGQRVAQRYGLSAWTAFRERPGACWWGA